LNVYGHISPFLPQLLRKIDLQVKKTKCNAIITSLQYVRTDSGSFMHLAPTAFSSNCNTGWHHVWL